MTPEVLRVNRNCAIPLSELEWRFETSGGRGGQHANRARTRAEVSFDVAASPSLTETQRQHLQARIGDVVRATAGDERSQARNRELALGRLRSRLAAGLQQDRPRKATRPTAGSRRRRLSKKRHRSDVKRTRRRPNPQD